MFNLTAFQSSVAVWSRKNFKDQPSYRPLLGIVEEVGELSHAHLKGEQGIRHTPEEIHALKIDAVGDIIVYLADYCTRERLDLTDCVISAWKIVRKRDWTEEKSDRQQ